MNTLREIGDKAGAATKNAYRRTVERIQEIRSERERGSFNTFDENLPPSDNTDVMAQMRSNPGLQKADSKTGRIEVHRKHSGLGERLGRRMSSELVDEVPLQTPPIVAHDGKDGDAQRRRRKLNSARSTLAVADLGDIDFEKLSGRPDPSSLQRSLSAAPRPSMSASEDFAGWGEEEAVFVAFGREDRERKEKQGNVDFAAIESSFFCEPSPAFSKPDGLPESLHVPEKGSRERLCSPLWCPAEREESVERVASLLSSLDEQALEAALLQASKLNPSLFQAMARVLQQEPRPGHVSEDEMCAGRTLL